MKERIDTTSQQIRRMNAVVAHVQRMGPASREWVLARLKAEECNRLTVTRLRLAGHR